MSGRVRTLLRQARRLAEYAATRGGSHWCPVCGCRSGSFLLTGESHEVTVRKAIAGAGRRRCRCAVCGSVDRERLVADFLSGELKGRAEREVLHVAPERALSRFLRRQGNLHVTKGDFYAEGYNYPADVMRLDLRELPFGDESFDLLICNHVLEHIRDDSRALSECFRVLRHGGVAILQVPYSTNSLCTDERTVATAAERAELYGQHDHVRLYGLDYRGRLEAAGFMVETYRPTPTMIACQGLNEREDLWIGRKP